LEKFSHQVLLTSKEAIRHIALMLPYSTKTLLHSNRIIEFAYLLKFIDILPGL